MERSFGLLFYLKKPKGYENGEVPVYLRITVNGVSAEISTKRKCDPSASPLSLKILRLFCKEKNLDSINTC